MNPPLDATPLHAPAPRATLVGPAALAPFAVHDLRAAAPHREDARGGDLGSRGPGIGEPGGREPIADDLHDAIARLRYPRTAALVFAGVPGAGKSTALLRFFGSGATELHPPTGPDGRVVIDSQHARNRWTRRLHRLPYPLWRPVVQIAHFATIRRALRSATGPVIIHDCGTFRWSRRLISRWASAHRRSLHIVMIDVAPPVARASQARRGRRSSGLFFDLHCRRWAELVGAVTDSAPARAASVIIADRTAINRLTAITFDL
ncbi:ATP-binding protein [Nocardia shimofusensis]|uniref:ATP-binding protein n=1 Tax=Nocardia shimofusensis TaxID=228596 RepID=UPI000A5C143A|nr:ATP-binding protein [Nocardia shimofusensis]